VPWVQKPFKNQDQIAFCLKAEMQLWSSTVQQHRTSVECNCALQKKAYAALHERQARRPAMQGRATLPPRQGPIQIKKYANRRLYHTGTSTYVTLEDLSKMVRDGEDFQVTDAKSGEDITRSVLAQIIFEQENKQGTQNLLPSDFLKQLIRFYGDSMQAMVPSFLQFSMQTLMSEQQKMRDSMTKNLAGTPFESLEAQTTRNMKMFMDAMRMFSPFPAGTSAPGPAEAASATQAPAGEDDLKQMRDQLAAMQSRLDGMAKK
jgi:polyhydroxyalkanoate synthesis repressor PhaR